MSDPSPEEVAAAAFADPSFPVLPEVCHAQHATRVEVHCQRPAGKCFGYHQWENWVGSTRDVEIWDNDAMPPKPEKHASPSKAQDIADRVKGPTAKGDLVPGPDHRFYKKDGPSTSRVAAEAGHMKRGTQLWQTADYLEANRGQWLGGVSFNRPEVGGQDGTRRLRQLREDFGWPIQGRKKEGSTEWEYRLVPEDELAPVAQSADE